VGIDGSEGNLQGIQVLHLLKWFVDVLAALLYFFVELLECLRELSLKFQEPSFPF
jgi:hypothetical protein